MAGLQKRRETGHPQGTGRRRQWESDLLGHSSAGIDAIALEGAEDGIEDALFDLISAFQPFNHLPMGMRIFQIHVD
jgi:hypothetical protein